MIPFLRLAGSNKRHSRAQEFNKFKDVMNLVSLEEITQGLTELRKQGFLLRCGNV